jgi:hypothetical protein
VDVVFCVDRDINGVWLDGVRIQPGRIRDEVLGLVVGQLQKARVVGRLILGLYCALEKRGRLDETGQIKVVCLLRRRGTKEELDSQFNKTVCVSARVDTIGDANYYSIVLISDGERMKSSGRVLT